jgi:hypothetical protein
VVQRVEASAAKSYKQTHHISYYAPRWTSVAELPGLINYTNMYKSNAEGKSSISVAGEWQRQINRHLVAYEQRRCHIFHGSAAHHPPITLAAHTVEVLGTGRYHKFTLT